MLKEVLSSGSRNELNNKTAAANRVPHMQVPASAQSVLTSAAIPAASGSNSIEISVLTSEETEQPNDLLILITVM